jgi:protein-disulfide isomerase
LVLKHNPLPFHARALPAAKAVVAAAEQGKAWELHRRLFAGKGTLDDAALLAAAREAGLDEGRFLADVSSPRTEEIVRRDQALARTVGATGTPTFFINGKRLQGAQPIDRFRAIIDEELARADKLVGAGTSAEEVYAKLMETASAAPPPEPHAARAPLAAERVDRVELGAAATRGPSHAKVTVVVFSDFECPFCSRGAAAMKALEERFGSRVRFAFKHHPLPMHPHARLAAAASLAAEDQGKFWQLHDALFAHQGQLDRAGLEKRAEELGLDLSRFRSALDSGAAEARLAADEAEAQRLGVNGTPTFFINDRRVVGAQPAEALAAVIDEELKR